MTELTEHEQKWADAMAEYAKPIEKKENQSGTWVMCKETKTLVRKEDYHSAQDSAMVMKELDPFVSPIDGQVIRDRAQLRAHNKEHGVTNTQDYGSAYFERRGKEMHNEKIGNTPKARAERREALNQQLHNHGIIR